MVCVGVTGKLCDPLVTHWSYVSALEIKSLYKFICVLYLYGVPLLPASLAFNGISKSVWVYA